MCSVDGWFRRSGHLGPHIWATLCGALGFRAAHSSNPNRGSGFMFGAIWGGAARSSPEYRDGVEDPLAAARAVQVILVVIQQGVRTASGLAGGLGHQGHTQGALLRTYGPGYAWHWYQRRASEAGIRGGHLVRHLGRVPCMLSRVLSRGTDRVVGGGDYQNGMPSRGCAPAVNGRGVIRTGLSGQAPL